MTADEFIRVASITLDEVRKAREQGADRERRRIRRAQRDALEILREAGEEGRSYRDMNACAIIDAATRAKRGKRK